MKITTIFFVRHGDYSNPEEIVPFRSNNVHLSPKGIEQIQSVGKTLTEEKIDFIISSPIQRCKETKIILHNILGCPAEEDERIIEVDSPLQEYKQTETKKLLGNDRLVYNCKEHQVSGETMEGVLARVQSLVEELLKKHPNKKIALVSHGDPIKIYLNFLEKKPLDTGLRMDDQEEENYPPKGSLTTCVFEEEKVKIKRNNY